MSYDTKYPQVLLAGETDQFFLLASQHSSGEVNTRLLAPRPLRNRVLESRCPMQMFRIAMNIQYIYIYIYMYQHCKVHRTALDSLIVLEQTRTYHGYLKGP